MKKTLIALSGALIVLAFVFSLSINVTQAADKLVKLNATCGAAAKTYKGTDTWFAIDMKATSTPFCAKGVVNGSDPVFPAIGGTEAWICLGENGGASKTCTAKRMTMPPVKKINIKVASSIDSNEFYPYFVNLSFSGGTALNPVKMWKYDYECSPGVKLGTDCKGGYSSMYPNDPKGDIKIGLSPNLAENSKPKGEYITVTVTAYNQSDFSLLNESSIIGKTEYKVLINKKVEVAPVVKTIDKAVLKLTYDKNKKETLLSGTQKISFTAGSKDLLVENLYLEFHNSPEPNSAKSNIDVLSGATKETIESGTYWRIKAGKTAQFKVSMTALPSEMYSGSYSVSLRGLYSIDNISTGYVDIPTFPESNVVNVVGENRVRASVSVPQPVSLLQKVLKQADQYKANALDAIGVVGQKTAGILNFILGR